MNAEGLRRVLTFIDEVRCDARRTDGEALRKVAVAAVIVNPYAAKPYSQDLSALVEPSAELGQMLGSLARDALGAPVQSHGKAAVVGTSGELEHALASKTSVSGDAFRGVTGGRAWLPSVVKRSPGGVQVDVPLCSNQSIWVASHYDAMTVTIHDAPLPDEIVVIYAVASRGRLNARLGGMTQEEAVAEAGRSSVSGSET